MDRQGKILDRFGSADGAQGLDDVAVAPDGNVYWTEPFSGQVKKLATGGAITSVAQLPPGANGITISPGGRIYVNTTVLSDTLWEVYPDGSTRTAVATHRDLAFPLNAIAFDGDVAVAELATGKVIRLSDRSTLGTGFTVPTGLAAIGGDLYVADFATGVVSKIVDDGTPLPSPVTVATGLAAPEGLTVDTDGGLLVAETGIGRVSKIDVATGTVTAVASNLAFGNNPVIPFVGPPTSPTWLSFTTVAVSPTSNDLYVAGDKADVSPQHRASVIYRIER